MDVLDTIADCARRNKVVRINYQKINGEYGTYYIEPYSLRTHAGTTYLFGFDRVEGHIKKFILGNIVEAVETDEEFEPQFEIEF